ncbi:multipass membrane protein [Candidatus Mancarchaeum acidiphilum]|jgi:hypothetical protein|uniref:Multipass membrane protein n=2 Tax=Candidatus Mancarchaeum acidiphilum TaxID=1920749 RepID=A0A218NNT5_9ARCH|nr:multipass membrane protein [Candidatus Mancarchaeum acidiphilum]MCL4345832.1 hypothetical protein [Candidatus Thermoplasmatota archaeon]
MDEDTLILTFLVSAPAFFITSLLWPGLFQHLISMATSGNIFYEIIGIAGIAYAVIGAVIIIIFAFTLLIYILVFGVIFFFPAYLIYTMLGLEYSLILVAVLCTIAILYFLETHTVSVEHYTIVVNPHRRYIIKR